MTASRNMPPVPWEPGRMRTPHECIIDHRIFYPKPSSKRFYCSQECRDLDVRRMHAVLERMKERRKARPLSRNVRKALGL